MLPSSSSERICKSKRLTKQKRRDTIKKKKIQEGGDGKPKLGMRRDVGHYFSREFRGGGSEAADGCSKWIFLVCNEATSRAAAAAGACSVSSGRMGGGRGRRIKDEGISGENG